MHTGEFVALNAGATNSINLTLSVAGSSRARSGLSPKRFPGDVERLGYRNQLVGPWRQVATL